MARFETVDAYIRSFAPEVRPVLESVRAAIRTAAPGTTETISYGIPTFTLDGRSVVYFAGWKRHISLYPIPAGDEAFVRQLARCRAEKGTLRFPLSEPMPLEVIGEVAALLVEQRRARGG